MHSLKPLPAPAAVQSFAVQVAPIAARLIEGARTVAIETAVALRVTFGEKRSALAACAAAHLITAAHGPAIVTLAVPAGAQFIALALATDSAQAASIAAREGARVVGLTVH